MSLSNSGTFWVACIHVSVSLEFPCFFRRIERKNEDEYGPKDGNAPNKNVVDDSRFGLKQTIISNFNRRKYVEQKYDCTKKKNEPIHEVSNVISLKVSKRKLNNYNQ